MILLLFPLIIMLLMTVFSLIFTTTFVSYTVSNLVDTNTMVNGSTTSIILENTATFSVDALVGAITWIVVLLILAGAVSINFLGSGLNPAGSRAIIIGTAWISTFVILSLYAFPLIVSIPYNLGSLLFVFLSIVYAFGVFKQLGGGNS